MVLLPANDNGSGNSRSRPGLNGEAEPVCPYIFIVELPDQVALQSEPFLTKIFDLPVQFIGSVPYINAILTQRVIPEPSVIFFNAFNDQGFPGSRIQLPYFGLQANKADIPEERKGEHFFPPVDSQPEFISIPVEPLIIRKGKNGQFQGRRDPLHDKIFTALYGCI